MASETTPLVPAADPYAGKTQKQLQQEKKDMLKGGLDDKLKQGAKDAGEEEEDAPDGPYDRCCAPCRGNFLFEQCVAREEKTPLNILHMFQPTMVVLLGVGMVLLSSGFLPLPTTLLRLICLVFQAAASGGMLAVGLIVRDIPSQEKLNVQLNNNIAKMGASVDDLEDSADTAGDLADMTIGWVANGAATRDRMKRLRLMLQSSQEEYYKFRFKYKLLLELAAGEQARFREEETRLRKEMEDKTMKEFNDKYSTILPDGLMHEDELRLVARIIKDTTTDGEGIVSKVDDIIETFLHEPDEPEAKEHWVERFKQYKPAVPYLAKLKLLMQKEGKELPAELEKLERGTRTSGRRFSMKTIVEMIVDIAETEFADSYNASIKPWMEEFDQTKNDAASAAEDKFGVKHGSTGIGK